MAGLRGAGWAMTTVAGETVRCAAELLRDLQGIPLLDQTGNPADPVCLLDLASLRSLGRDEILVLAQAIAAGPRIVLGVSSDALNAAQIPVLQALDGSWVAGRGESGAAVAARCVLGEEGPLQLGAVLDGIAANPAASLTLRQVLHAAEPLAVPAALVVESLAYSTLLGGREFRRWLADYRANRLPQAPVPIGRADEVVVAFDERFLRIELNRPERRNAYSAAMRDGLVEALRIAQQNPGLHVELRGAGPAFCSGGDLGEFGTATDLVQAHFLRTAAGAAPLAHGLRRRLTVFLHGACIGAGIEIPAFAETVIADAETVFRLPEIGMGLIPGAGGATSVPRRIGRHRTFAWCVSAQAIGAPTALAWGLVDRVTASS